jgi:5,10-methylenetetrahydrofolate reductase
MFEQLLDKLKHDRYITLETTPSHEPNITNILDKIFQYNLDKKVDGFSVTDNPLAKLKYSPILASIKIQQEFKKPVICTMSMRDRNIIALQSDLLAMNDFDIRAILALTGDPAKLSDQPDVKGVFEGNSLKLLEIINNFNSGKDLANKEFKSAPKPMFPFAVSNSYANNFDSLFKKMGKKIDTGAKGIITQPVFDIDIVKKLLEEFKQFGDTDARLIFGIFPVTSYKTVKFLRDHIPGIFVPDSWVNALEIASKISKDEEYKVGLELSQNIFKEIMKIYPKVHIMTANKFDIADRLLD